MNRALALTLAEKQEGWITPDTIRTYRSHLQLTALRDKSYLTYALGDSGNGIRSNTMRGQDKLSQYYFRGYANCSVASVWRLSDQRLPLALSLLTVAWCVFSCLMLRKRHFEAVPFGGIVYLPESRSFVNSRRETVSLTPMELQLMQLFYSSPDHRLTKQQICDALWPKKPDASDTLYTLIRRLKQVLRQQTNLQIVSGRGKDYQLRESK